MVNHYMADVEQGESADKQVSEKRSSLRFPLRLSEFKGKSQGIPEKQSVMVSPPAPRRKMRSPPPPSPAGALQSQSLTQLNVQLLSTNDTGLIAWGSTRFQVMESGHIVLWGKTSDDSPTALYMFLQGSEGFKKVREVKGFCEHDDFVYLQPVKVKVNEFLAVSCARCRKIRLYDMNNEEVNTAFHYPEYYPGPMSSGEEGVMYVVRFMVGFPVLKLNTEQMDFTGPHETIQSGVEKLYSMIHIPAPHNLLVFSSNTHTIIRAVSTVTGWEEWELRGEVEEKEGHPHGMFFSQDHQALLAADGKNSRILVLDPTDRSVIKTIQLDDEMGIITELCIQKQKLIMHHNRLDKEKVSFFSIK